MGPMGNDQAMLDYFLEMGQLAPEQEAIARQRAMAQQLRGAAPPAEGRMVGRTYVKANPLEHLAGVAGAGLGAYKDRQADAANTALMGKRSGAFDRLRGKYGMGATPGIAAPTIFDEGMIPGQ